MNLTFLQEGEGSPDKLKVGIVLVLIAFVVNMTLPQTVKAEYIILSDSDKLVEVVLKSTKSVDILTEKFKEYDKKQTELKTKKPLRVSTVIATAYSSTVDQTDSTPCITADGFNVCKHAQEDVIAANFLPFNTKVRIPELYGDKIFTVHDRMNRRYSNRIDLWKLSRNDAITFGKRLVKIEVVEYSR
jgi:3D (Asp-Asp-Asp) domain-containing protein